MRILQIGSDVISDDSECFVIAEIGHNHQGDIQKAKDLIRAAHEAGAQAVKLQKRDNRAVFTRELYDSPYNSEHSYGPTYGTHREALEFGRDAYQELQAYAAALGITFFATAFDTASADMLAELDMPAYKIASGDLLNTPLLRHVASFGKPVLISTGGGTLDDVKRAYETVASTNPRVCILQCTAMYPTEPEDMNLRVITTFRQEFPEVPIGLSDHQNGYAMSLVGYVLGARVIEKHFTLNRAWRGSDHAFSLEPLGLRKLVRDLRRARLALGDGIKRPLPAEARALFKMGKKLVAARELSAGTILTAADIVIKSPNDGLPPYELDKLIGLTLRANLKQDEPLTWELVGTRQS